MLGTVSFSDKACLVVGSKMDLSNLITHTLRQIGLVNVTKADGTDHGFLLLTKTTVDLLILLAVPAGDAVGMLQNIRGHNLPAIASVPVICVAEAWSGEQITALRDAGVSVLATLPLTMRTLLKHTTRALNPREFVAVPTYRGPCRRSGPLPNFTGPHRRRSEMGAAKAAPSKREPLRTPHSPIEGARAATPAVLRPPASALAARSSAGPESLETPELRQTKIVIDNSYDTAMEVDGLSTRLRDAGAARERAALCREIALASERMINLMSLADHRVREFGCSDGLVGRLESIRTTIVRNAEGLAESGARHLADYGGRIVAGVVGIPLGVGVAMARQMARIDAIVHIFGGIDAMSATCRAAVLHRHRSGSQSRTGNHGH